MEPLDLITTAQELIERIRLEHSPQGVSKLSSIIKNALEILSAELYDSSTHFLREFLQNADDNDYNPDVVPWLQLSYDPGYLRVDCNEIGFGAENVEAICTIRSSTKIGETHAGRTGEKGIGFKSVFKIAKVVWVSSREYSFKFDKSLDFGMIAPIWEEFPRPLLKNHTSFLLQLDENCDEGQIVHGLRNFDHNCLLFLRRLRHVTLNVQSNGSSQTSEIRRRDEIRKDVPITIIQMGEREFTFIITKEQVQNLPKEPKRAGIGSSELILAFPEGDGTNMGSETSSNEDQQQGSQVMSQAAPVEAIPTGTGEVFPKEPVFKCHNVHATLPIGQYGLKFVVQGDFLLTANRRHIDISSPWNIALRDAVPDAFLTAISCLNSGRMRFSWPAFIPSTEMDSFFEPVRGKLLAILKGLPILESCSGHLTVPSNLTYVGESFLDEEGEPLCSSEHTRSIYLSRSYPLHLREILTSLGVEELSNKEFVEHFEQMLLEDEAKFRAQPDGWHSEVAKALLPLAEDHGLKEILRRVPIVPLSNGQWVSAISEPHTFQEQSMLGDLQVFDSLRIVHPAATENGNRRSLWSSLDIKPIDRQGICQYIVGAHENPVVDPMVWTRAQLVAHARFLYSSEWRPPRPVDLWVETSRLMRFRSSQAYYFTGTASDCDERTTRVFKQMKSNFHVLHDDYSFPALNDGNEDTSDEAIEDFVGTGSPQCPQHFEDGGKAQVAPHPIFEGAEDPDSSVFENSVESGTTSSSEIIDDEFDRALPNSTRYLEDIADVPSLAYPISAQGFREFVNWKSCRREWDHLLQNQNRHNEPNALEDEDTWLSYLKNVLQVATLPRLAATSLLEKDRGSLILNYDMRWLFNKFNASDVLHVLISNWHHYAHLIEPQSISDQSEEEKLQELRNMLWHPRDGADFPDDISSEDLNARLMRELRRTRVNVGNLEVKLWDCVLSNLDPRFDDDPEIPLPTLELENLSSEVRKRLQYFTISVEADTTYYLKCLRAVTKRSAPTHSAVKRLYEELQSRFDGDERLIRGAFNNMPLAGCSKRASGNDIKHCQGSWMTISASVEQGFDLVSQYPTCTYLFRSLCEPSSLQITSLINSLSTIPRTQPKDRIFEVLEQLSQRLKGLELKSAAEKVRLLKGKRIFPVSNASDTDQDKSYRLVSANSSHWYIDDTNEFRRCFEGKVPLLAASSLLVGRLRRVLAAMNLDSRKLSEVATRSSRPIGRQRLLTDVTAFLRSRHCFLDPLIPKDHSGGRDAISLQLQSISAFSASEILQTFKLVTDQLDVAGRGPSVEAATMVEGSSLRLFFSESDLGSLSKSWQWVNLLAEHMEIDDQMSLNLLSSAMTDTDTYQVNRYFKSRGYTIHYPTDTMAASKALSDPQGRYLSMSGDAAPMISAFDLRRMVTQNPHHAAEWTFGAMSNKMQRDSRKIPMVRLLQTSGTIGDLEDPESSVGMSGFFKQGSLSHDPFPEYAPYLRREDPDCHKKYIAECIVSQLFQERLGGLYDPVQYWTSSLRSRSGLPDYTGDPGAAPFTMSGRDLSKSIWKLLIESSYRHSANFADLGPRFSSDTIYHFEIFATEGDSSAWFPLTASTLENARANSTLPRALESPDEVFDSLDVWIRIYSAFTNPRFDFIVDPWLYYPCGGMDLRDFQEARIHLVDNPAEDEELEHICRLVDDLTPEVNISSPSLDMPQNLGTEPGRRQTAIPPNYAEGKATARQLRYHYTRLKKGDIRLLVLFRGEGHDILQGLVCHMPFERAGAFRALSYVWGPEQANPNKRILVTPQGVINVRTSLGAALHRLRKKTQELVLWVDAICINQDDDDEKVQQISLLPQIFQRSICTLAVVATDSKSEETVRTLLQISAVHAYGSDLSKWPAELESLKAGVPWIREGLPAQGSTFWQDVEYLFRRPWFRRAWIVQEAVAARSVTIVCGKLMINWNAVHIAMEQVEKRLGTTKRTDSWRPFMILTEHREWEARSQRWPLLYLLETFRHVQAGLQRDRFFSLLGLASDADNPLYEPDYKSPFETIVRRFGRAFVEHDDGMTLLCRAGLGHVEPGNELRASRFPSWVPDWTKSTYSNGSLSSAVGRGVTFSASGKLEPDIYHDPEDEVLEVAAEFCTTILSVSRFCNEPSQRNKYFEEIDAMIEACDLIHPDQHQRLKETVPVAGALLPDMGVSSPVSVSESYMAYRKVLRKDELRSKSMRSSGKRKGKQFLPPGGGSKPGLEPIPTGYREKSKSYVAMLDTCILGWKFCITEEGHCGLAPPGVLPGDNVWIVSGGNVPFIFRDGHDPGLGTFLVGECYMDGLMFGEGIKDLKAGSEIEDTLFLS